MPGADDELVGLGHWDVRWGGSGQGGLEGRLFGGSELALALHAHLSM